MKMKNIIYVVSLLLLVVSCDYLDIKPVGKVIPEKVTEFRALLTSGYATMPRYKYLLAFRADEVVPASDKDVYSQLIDFSIWNDNSPSAMVAYPWYSPYNVIFYANSVIEDVMEAEIDTEEDSREQILGEAYLLRAYSHFELLNLYGKPYDRATAASDEGIPLALKIDVEQEFYRSSIEDVYTQIFSDLENGQKYLTVEEQAASVRYRFSKKSAKALEARVRLYHNDWKEAMELAEDLIPACPLEDLNADEAILPYTISSKEAILCMESWGDYDLQQSTVVLSNLTDKYNVDEDARFGRYFSGTPGAYKPLKGANNNQFKVNIRSAEIYLIAAEAAAHVDGKLDQAKKHLKDLLKNRLSASYYLERAEVIDNMNQQQLLEEILNERAREFALEGHRWFDLRRMGCPVIVKKYMDDKGQQQTVTLEHDDVRYTISLPKEATENNPNLGNVK